MTHNAPFRLFVYGALKRSQPGIAAVEELVVASDVAVGRVMSHHLETHDGLAFMRPGPGSAPVRGELLTAVAGRERELLDRVKRFEGSMYRAEQVSVITDGGSTFPATAFVARSGESRTDWEEIRSGEWTAADDAVLGGAVPALFRAFTQILGPFPEEGQDPRLRAVPRSVEDRAYWDELLPLQGAFLNLCTLLERASLFRFNNLKPDTTDRSRSTTDDNKTCPHCGKVLPPEPAAAGPASRIAQLDEDRGALDAVIRAQVPNFTVWAAYRSGESTSVLTSEKDRTPDKPFKAWYAVRSNLTHQGKNPSLRNWRLLQAASVGLFDSLAFYLAEAIPGIAPVWAERRFKVGIDLLRPLAPNDVR
ncbi:MAG: hypothetical protein F2534_21990 [Actinobacteria bacterium]|uniref:Unannotated protein n=1 Tax=freshwater metagenome TaxID=449393 RepID=A0A6J6GFU4_9ZZZZ|nr:hypothetical protein [Actinomycetota bacterium]